MAAFRTIAGMDFKGKRVLLRADLNVPVQDGKVTDATRIERVVPTIREITKAGGKAILISHFGRPKGKVDKAYSLEQVVPAIVEATRHPVGFIDTDWTNVQAAGEAIDDAPDDVPVADAVETLQEEVAAVAAANLEMANGLGCPTSSSSS